MEFREVLKGPETIHQYPMRQSWKHCPIFSPVWKISGGKFTPPSLKLGGEMEVEKETNIKG
jgi:hypothetical protein